MRILTSVHEFKDEAANALFTKQQAVAVTLQLLEKERTDPANTPEEEKMFAEAIAKAEFRYIDATSTQTDRMLDDLSVARFTAQSISEAIEALLFDVK